MSFQKKIKILIALLFNVSVFCIQDIQAAIPEEIKEATDSLSSDLSKINISDSIINYGKLFLNTPYSYGADGAESFDCSGFTCYVFRNFGFDLVRSSAGQSKQFPHIEKEDLRPGDLVFFNGRRRNGKVGHVGIVTANNGNGNFDFMHASTSQGVTISNSNEIYYKKRFVTGGRVLNYDSLLYAQRISTLVNQSPVFRPISSQTVKRNVPAEYHYVKKGETLTSISEKYGLSIDELKELNHLKKNSLKIKQKLMVKDAQVFIDEIPGTLAIREPEMLNVDQREHADVEGLRGNVADVIEKETPKKHLVTKGETLFAISKKYNISTSALEELNHLKNGKIYIGQELRLSDEPEKDLAVVGKTVKATPQKGEIVTDPVIEQGMVQSASGKHEVQKGESLFSISKKYNMPVDEIVRLNNLKDNKILVGQILNTSVAAPKQDAENAIAKNTVKPAVIENDMTSALSHKVQKGETLSSIARKYNQTVKQIETLNDLSDGKIFIGQMLKVRADETKESKPESVASIQTKKQTTTDKNQPVSEAPTETHYQAHKVLSGESLYSISKKYNIPIDEIKTANNLTGNTLQPGQELRIPGDISVNQMLAANSSSANLVRHEVAKGETLSDIANKYHCSVNDLKKWNNKNSSRLNAGEVLRVYKN
ncbi:MAG: LysM peptidoglycan-binding domain-containing protein [Paludibacter sp.]|nr:LysM peptidoglycan-binding domain-containing protein [Paludibacter sp.]